MKFFLHLQHQLQRVLLNSMNKNMSFQGKNCFVSSNERRKVDSHEPLENEALHLSSSLAPFPLQHNLKNKPNSPSKRERALMAKTYDKSNTQYMDIKKQEPIQSNGLDSRNYKSQQIDKNQKHNYLQFQSFQGNCLERQKIKAAVQMQDSEESQKHRTEEEIDGNFSVDISSQDVLMEQSYETGSISYDETQKKVILTQQQLDLKSQQVGLQRIPSLQKQITSYRISKQIGIVRVLISDCSPSQKLTQVRQGVGSYVHSRIVQTSKHIFQAITSNQKILKVLFLPQFLNNESWHSNFIQILYFQLDQQFDYAMLFLPKQISNKKFPLGSHGEEPKHSKVYLVGYPDYFKQKLLLNEIDSVKPVISIRPFKIYDRNDQYLYYTGDITYGGESGSPICIKQTKQSIEELTKLAHHHGLGHSKMNEQIICAGLVLNQEIMFFQCIKFLQFVLREFKQEINEENLNPKRNRKLSYDNPNADEKDNEDLLTINGRKDGKILPFDQQQISSFIGSLSEEDLSSTLIEQSWSQGQKYKSEQKNIYTEDQASTQAETIYESTEKQQQDSNKKSSLKSEEYLSGCSISNEQEKTFQAKEKILNLENSKNDFYKQATSLQNLVQLQANEFIGQIRQLKLKQENQKQSYFGQLIRIMQKFNHKIIKFESLDKQSYIKILDTLVYIGNRLRKQLQWQCIRDFDLDKIFLEISQEVQTNLEHQISQFVTQNSFIDQQNVLLNQNKNLSSQTIQRDQQSDQELNSDNDDKILDKIWRIASDKE